MNEEQNVFTNIYPAINCYLQNKGVGVLLEPALPCHSPVGQQKFSSCPAPLGGMRHSGGDEAEDKTIKLCFSSSKHFKDSIKLICTTAWLHIPSGSPAWLLSLSALPRWWATLPLLFKFLLHFVKILLTLPFWQKPCKTPLIWNKIKCLALSMCKKRCGKPGLEKYVGKLEYCCLSETEDCSGVSLESLLFFVWRVWIKLMVILNQDYSVFGEGS